MRILKSVDELRVWRAEQKGSVGLVPTMGALHAGHISLVRAAASENAAVLTTIFVNPTQFGPHEDFDQYPRTLEADCTLLKVEAREHASVEFAVFAPEIGELYPEGAATFVTVEGLDGRLDGGSRPGHFRGVATVVTKLLTLAGATRAYFGQKDGAQVAVIRRFVRDLFLPTEICVCPIVREADGLALSSRNRYLSAEERRQALVLSRALRAVEESYASGERDAEALKKIAREVFAVEPAVRIDYVELVDWATLLPIEQAVAGNLFAVAAYVGETRLIDNLVL